MIYCKRVINDDVDHGVGIRVTLELVSEMDRTSEDKPITDEFIKTIVDAVTKDSRISGYSIIGEDIFDIDSEIDEIEFKEFFDKLNNDLVSYNCWLYTNCKIVDLMSKSYIKHEFFRDIIKNVEVLVEGKFNPALERNNLMFRNSYNQNVVYIHKRENCSIPEKYKDVVTLEYCA